VDALANIGTGNQAHVGTGGCWKAMGEEAACEAYLII